MKPHLYLIYLPLSLLLLISPFKTINMHSLMLSFFKLAKNCVITCVAISSKEHLNTQQAFPPRQNVLPLNELVPVAMH